jgi:hypothetical protein
MRSYITVVNVNSIYLLWTALLRSECWQTYSFLNVALLHEGNGLCTIQAEYDFNWKSRNQSCSSYSSFTCALITIFQLLDSTICPLISSILHSISHFHCKFLPLLTVNTSNQRSVVSALLPTSKQDSMIVSRDYTTSTWCLWRFLIQSYCTLRHWFSNTAPPPIAECTYELEICFPGVKSGRGVTLTPHPLLVPWSRKGRAIPPLPLWAARPVQSLSACTCTWPLPLHNQ